MKSNDKLISLYIDKSPNDFAINTDDFLITIGKSKSNSVYHVESVKSVIQKNGLIRYYVKVFRSDLITMLKRDKNQLLTTVFWYGR
jgi:hypothetical protein